MSAVFAIAEPRRIKATHRRRRKIAAGQIVQRYYDPAIGRFLSVDPMASDMNSGWNFNRYNYAANSPYKFTDPDGRSIWSKLVKLAVKGGNVAQVTAGLVSDFNTIANPAASTGDKVLAAVSMISEALPVSIGDAKDGAKLIKAIAGKGDVAGDAAKLEKQLASGQQLGELRDGAGVVTHGAGTSEPLKQAERLAEQYGGKAADYQKVSSSAHKAADGGHVETHAYRNAETGEIVEPKTIVAP